MRKSIFFINYLVINFKKHDKKFLLLENFYLITSNNIQILNLENYEIE